MRKRKLAMLLDNNFKEYCGHHLSCKETEFQQPAIKELYLVISTHFDLEILQSLVRFCVDPRKNIVKRSLQQPPRPKHLNACTQTFLPGALFKVQEIGL